MTSTVTVVFETARKFVVTIDNIDNINPQALEQSFIAIEKEFGGMKGARVAARKVAERATAEAKAAQEIVDAEMKSLEEEELSKFKAEAIGNAAKVYEKATKAGKKKLEDEAKEDAAKARGQQFLADVGATAESKST